MCTMLHICYCFIASLLLVDNNSLVFIHGLFGWKKLQWLSYVFNYCLLPFKLFLFSYFINSLIIQGKRCSDFVTSLITTCTIFCLLDWEKFEPFCLYTVITCSMFKSSAIVSMQACRWLIILPWFSIHWTFTWKMCSYYLTCLISFFWL